MIDKHIEKFYDDVLCKDIKILTEILATISNSYRLLVGAAEEFNRISLVHRHDAEEAIDRADDLGEIIDDVDRELKKLMKLYLQELSCKIEYQGLYNNKASVIISSKPAAAEFIEELEDNE
ncbi:MAG: hypothetical protein K0R80_429 [Clostridia bacterium]|nr:hypothetical protein [Clostridia bacterium]